MNEQIHIHLLADGKRDLVLALVASLEELHQERIQVHDCLMVRGSPDLLAALRQLVEVGNGQDPKSQVEEKSHARRNGRPRAADQRFDNLPPLSVSAERADEILAHPGQVQCSAEDCDNWFTPPRKDSRFCSKACYQRNYHRQRQAKELAA